MGLGDLDHESVSLLSWIGILMMNFLRGGVLMKVKIYNRKKSKVKREKRYRMERQ